MFSFSGRQHGVTLDCGRMMASDAPRRQGRAMDRALRGMNGGRRR